MKFFLDSAHVHEIEHALKMWNLDGVTTNPKHIQASGKPFMVVIREIAALFAGTEKTVSVEVNPHLTNYEAMVAEAEKLAALSPNFVIKLPATEAGFKSIAVLKGMGIRSNLTLIFSAAQALHAMRMGAFYVSPFIGWKESNAEETLSMIEDIVAIRDNFDFDTEILVAADRGWRRRWRRHRHRGICRLPGGFRSSVHPSGIATVPEFLGSDAIRVKREA